MYKAILFDMDGTVVDTERVWLLAAEHVLQNRGIQLTDEQREKLHEELMGLSLHAACLYLQQWMELSNSPADIMQEKMQFSQRHYYDGIDYIPGFKQFHAQLQQYGLPSAIATNANTDMITMTDRSLGLRSLFGDHIYCVDDVGASKPAPDIYQHAAHKLGILPSESIVIEDSARGVQAARDAGAYCIGINTSGDRNQLSQADYVVDRYNDIDLASLLSHS